MSPNQIIDPYSRPWDRKDVLTCVGPGWHRLVDELIDDLFELGWDGNLHQIKEKFGGLRFYIGCGSDEIFNRINKAEIESCKTCEVCGEPGRNRYGGWAYTRCDKCWRKFLRDRRKDENLTTR